MKNFSPQGHPQQNNHEWRPDISPDDQYLDLVYHPNSNVSGQSSPDTSTFFSLIFYLVPIIGVFPSLWTLYRRDGTREQIAISRLSTTLTLTWILSYLLLATGAETSHFAQLRLMILNSFFTSGYFLVSIWLIFRTIKGKTQRLPGITPLSRRIFAKKPKRK